MPRISFEQLRCASVFDTEDVGAARGVEFPVDAFGDTSVRGALVPRVLYLPHVRLQVLEGGVAPLEGVSHPAALRFEQDRNFAGNADRYRATFDVTHSSDEVCILSNFYSRNFFHWVTEELVKVVLLERSGFKGRYVICNLPAFAAPFLEILGVHATRLTREVHAPTIFESVAYVTAITGQNVSGYPRVFHGLRESITAAVPPIGRPRRRLWLDRGPAANPGRDLVNTEEIYVVLDRYGFERVDMAALTVRDQLALAGSTRVLSGLHGAALTHAMFMPPAANVVECFSPVFVHPSFLELYRLMRHRYFMIVYEHAYEKYAFGTHVKINPSHLELTLQTIG